jgi:hypothetical protein
MLFQTAEPSRKQDSGTLGEGRGTLAVQMGNLMAL